MLTLGVLELVPFLDVNQLMLVRKLACIVRLVHTKLNQELLLPVRILQAAEIELSLEGEVQARLC